MEMSETSIEEYTEKMRERYARMTGRKARGKVLDELIEITGWERKHASAVKALVEVRAQSWDTTAETGCTEVDTVATWAEIFIWTLTSVEIGSGWTGLRAVWNRGQNACFEGLESIWESQPFDLVGVDSDNGGEFLNFHLYHWLKKHGIHQTRSRSYCKNDQAYVEQKNHTHVRQFLGYERLEHRELLGELNVLLKLWSQWRNLFCVKMKQESKRREGSRQIRRHEKIGRTPAQRLIDSGDLRQAEQSQLEVQLATLDPFAVRQEIRRLEDQFWSHREKLYESQAQQRAEDEDLALAGGFGA
jgi:hypothetical protein